MKKKTIILALISLSLALTIHLMWNILDIPDDADGKVKSVNTKEIIDSSQFDDKITEQAQMHLPDLDEISGYGIRLFSGDGDFINKTISYVGNKCRMYVSLANANLHNDKGELLIIIDNKPIKYTVSNMSSPTYLYSFELEPYSMINIPIEILLDEKDSNALHNIWFFYIYNLDDIPSEDKPIAYFVNAYRMELISKDNVALNNETYENTNNFVVDLDDNFVNSENIKTVISIEDDRLYQKHVIEASKSQDTDFTIRSFVNAEEELFSTIVIFNNEPIKLNENDNFIVWKASEGKMLESNFTITMPESKGEYQMYGITIPLEKTNIYGFEYPTSHRICILIGD